MGGGGEKNPTVMETEREAAKPGTSTGSRLGSYSAEAKDGSFQRNIGTVEM